MKSPIQTKIPAAKQIDYIMKAFDFAGVREAMTKLDWKWWDSEGVPSIPRLQSVARDCLQAIGGETIAHSVGGFYATLDQWGHRTLAFSIAVADSSELESLS